MKRPTRTICAACHAIGHTVNRCESPVAADYWRAAAVRFRAQAEEHEARMHIDNGEAVYHARAAKIALEDAERAERKASAPGGKLEAVPKPRGKQ